ATGTESSPSPYTEAGIMPWARSRLAGPLPTPSRRTAFTVMSLIISTPQFHRRSEFRFQAVNYPAKRGDSILYFDIDTWPVGLNFQLSTYMNKLLTEDSS